MNIKTQDDRDVDSCDLSCSVKLCTKPSNKADALGDLISLHPVIKCWKGFQPVPKLFRIMILKACGCNTGTLVQFAEMLSYWLILYSKLLKEVVWMR